MKKNVDTVSGYKLIFSHRPGKLNNFLSDTIYGRLTFYYTDEKLYIKYILHVKRR